MHPLIVHLVTVAFPTASLLILVEAFWPALRRRLGVITPLIALVSLIAVPLATSSGESLEERVGHSALLEAHTQLGDTLLPWAIAVFVVAVAQWAWQRWVLTAGSAAPTADSPARRAPGRRRRADGAGRRHQHRRDRHDRSHRRLGRKSCLVRLVGHLSALVRSHDVASTGSRAIRRAGHAWLSIFSRDDLPSLSPAPDDLAPGGAA